jgi:hypothetical protein
VEEQREPSDHELLYQARVEPEAFAAFYRRHERAVLGYMLRRTGAPEIADTALPDPGVVHFSTGASGPVFDRP